MIALIDADSLIYVASYKRTPDEAVLSLTDRIDQILIATEASEYALFLSEGKTFRHNIEGYKSTRPKERKSPVFYYIKEYMKSNLNAISQYGVEADDLVTYWNQFRHKSIVCSPDKDVFSSNDKCYNYQKRKFTTNSQDEIDYFFWKQMLMGDNADAIKGIPSCGDKTSDKFLQEVKTNIKLGKSDINISQMVLNKYLMHFGMVMGIEQFYKNYKQLYILRTNQDFEINNLKAPSQLNTVKRNEI
jgi:5'-3' exonuclease